MSKTLFWYVLRDLLRIFLMASGVLAGILSFGGMLRPLMQYGLSGMQVAQMLAYFMPATQTYSLPIAALFATTLVYGRLSADNELTACRASGISYFAMALPAMVLGLVLALVSLLCLSYVVPHFTLKVEKVAFQSLAEVVRRNIDRNRQLRIQGHVVFAEHAEILPRDPQHPGREVVILDNPMFCLYAREDNPLVKGEPMQVPSEFFMARSARVELQQQPTGGIEFSVQLEDGTMLPVNYAGSSIGGIRSTAIPPLLVASPIHEKTKFMNIGQLKELYADPARSREIQARYTVILRRDQAQAFAVSLRKQLEETSEVRLAGSGQTLRLAMLPGASLRVQDNDRMSLTSPDGERNVLVAEGTQEFRTAQAQVRTIASVDGKSMQVLVLFDSPAGVTRRAQSSAVTVPMPEELRRMEERGPKYYLTAAGVRTDEIEQLSRKLSGLQNGIEGEVHARAAFAVSCFILVIVGCALGMMFRTGNYLSAFALSVVPALLTIALITTGQHITESQIPGSLRLGLAMIWSGNVAALVLGAALLRHLQRQ